MFEHRDDDLIQPLEDPIEGVIISDEEAKLAPKLMIQIVEGVESMIGNQIMINAQGLQAKGLNLKKDGCTIIGCRLLKQIWNL